MNDIDQGMKLQNEANRTRQLGMGQTGRALGCCEGRQSGKGALQGIIGRLRRKADNLQTVLHMLPEQPTPEQDQHLWELAQDLGV